MLCVIWTDISAHSIALGVLVPQMLYTGDKPKIDGHDVVVLS